MSAPRPPEPRDWFPVVLKLLPKGRRKVLDAGCGEVFWTQPNYEIHCCDIEPPASPPPNFRQVDLNQPWCYENEEFNGVIAVEVLEHLENPRHFFREAKRVAKEFIIVTTPNPCCRENRERFCRTGAFKWFDGNAYQDFGHITPVFLWQLRQIASELGLRIVAVTYNNPKTEEILIAKVVK